MQWSVEYIVESAEKRKRSTKHRNFAVFSDAEAYDEGKRLAEEIRREYESAPGKGRIVDMWVEGTQPL